MGSHNRSHLTEDLLLGGGTAILRSPPQTYIGKEKKNDVLDYGSVWFHSSDLRTIIQQQMVSATLAGASLLVGKISISRTQNAFLSMRAFQNH